MKSLGVVYVRMFRGLWGWGCVCAGLCLCNDTD